MNTTRPKAGPFWAKSASNTDFVASARRFMGAALLVFLLPVLAGMPAGADSLTVVDAEGKRVTIALPVGKVVVLNSDALEVMRALDAEQYVAGVFSGIMRQPLFWGNLADRPKVGSWREPNLEAIAVLKPDLVLAYSRNPGPVLERKMASLGIQVLRLDFYKIDTLEREVAALGRLLDRHMQAGRFCRWYRNRLEMISARLGTGYRPRVYLESYSDYHASGPGSGADQMCRLAGGRNVAAKLAVPYPRVTPEWVLARDPEVIVKAMAYGNGYARKSSAYLDRCRDAILKRPAWNHVAAVKSANVHVMDSSIWSGPRAIVGIAYMARWFHPGYFADLDPAGLHSQYLARFQHLDFRGAFVSASQAGR